MPEPIFMKLGMYVMAPMSISMAYFINPSHQSVSMSVSPIIARKWFGKNVTVATNTHAAIEELQDASLYMRSVPYEGKQAISSSQKFLLTSAVLIQIILIS
jgi:hypothetical protein